MALNIGTLLAILRLDSKEFVTPLKAATKQLDETASKMRDLSGKFALVAAGLGAIGIAAIEAASAFDETTGKIQAVFGSGSTEIEEWAKTTHKSLSMGRQQARLFASDLGAVIAPMVGSQKAAVGMSQSLVEVASNLRASFNSTNAEAITALRAGITGEAEPLKKFGIVMLDTTLSAFALSQGITKAYTSMGIAEKTALRYQFILAQASLVQGSAAREAAGWGGQLELAKGTIDDLAITLGGPLKSAFTPVLTAFNEFGERLQNISPGMIELVARVGAFIAIAAGAAAVVFGLAGAIGGVIAATPILISGFVALGTTILPIVAIMGILVVVFGAAYRAWLQFGNGIKSAAGTVFGGMIDTIGGFLKTVAGAVAKFNALWIDGLLLIPRAMLYSFNLALKGLSIGLQKIEPVLRKLGLDELADFARTGAQVTIKADQDIDSMFENVRATLHDFVDPAKLIENLGTSAKWFGDQIVDGVAFGLDGAKMALADLFGVDLSKYGLAAPPPGVDQDLTALGGKPPKAAKLKAFKDPFGDDKIYTSFYEATKDALKRAADDPGWWMVATHRFAFGLADAISSVLPDSLKSAVNEGAKGLFNLLGSEGGQNMLLAGAKGLDSILGGQVPDLGAIGMAIGNAIVPGLGGVVGKALGDGLGKIAEAIQNLANQIVDGIVSMATTVGEILISGAQNTSGVVGGIGKGAAFVGTAASTAGAAAGLGAILGVIGAALAGLAAAIGSVYAAMALLLFPVTLIVGSIMAALAASLLLLAAAVTVVLSPLLILGAAIAAFAVVVALATGWLVALLQIGTMTKSFERFSLALEWGARQVITAVEPLFVALMPLAGVFVTMATLFGQLSGTFIALMANLGVFELFFQIMLATSLVVVHFSLALLQGAETFVKVLKMIADVFGLSTTKLQQIDDAIDDWQSELTAAGMILQQTTLANAAAAAENAAALEEMALATEEATAGTLNLPEAFKLAAARGNAIDGDQPGGGGGGGNNGTRFQGINPIVNIWINGETAENVRRESDRTGRFQDYVDTGLVVRGTSKKRKHTIPHIGN